MNFNLKVLSAAAMLAASVANAGVSTFSSGGAGQTVQDPSGSGRSVNLYLVSASGHPSSTPKRQFSPFSAWRLNKINSLAAPL